MMNPSPFPPMSVRSRESNLPYAFYYFPLSVSRCPAEILTSHSIKSCPDTKDAADQGPPHDVPYRRHDPRRRPPAVTFFRGTG
jgi:hypothetical protein